MATEAKNEVSKSKILNKLKKKAKGAYARAKEGEAKAKGIWEPPGGIQDAVAQLSSWKLGEDKKGNPYFQIKGVIKSPSKYKGKPIFISHFISETPQKTIEDKLAGLCNDLKLLGADLEGTEEVEELVGVLDSLCESKPHFSFNTWKPTDSRNGQEPRSFIFIQGIVEDYEDDDSNGDEGGEDDETPEDETPEDDEAEDDGEGGNGDGDEGGEDAGDDEPWVPAKGDIYNYKAGPKAKPQECKVTSVNTAKKLVGLKRESDGTVYKDVSWDRLESA